MAAMPSSRSSSLAGCRSVSERSRRAGWLLAALGLLCALDCRAQPESGDGDATTLPDPTVLEQRGARIGRVDIRIDNVFDPSNPSEDKALYRWANRVHFTTRPSVIEEIVLFEPGELFRARLLEETARLLRARGFVAEAAVTATRYDPVTNTADVDVWVRDAWSLEPDIKFSRSGGENEWGFGLSEDNLFGTGKHASVNYRKDVDRDELRLEYSDRNVNGTRVRLDFGLADLSDGKRNKLDIGRPFFALDTRWSVGSSLLDDERVDSIYGLGEVVDEFRHDTQAFAVQGGVSAGINAGRTKRWLFGVDYEKDVFLPTLDGPAPQVLPQDRTLLAPWIGWELIREDFRKVSELNSIGRIEDIALGLDFLVKLGRASDRFGSDRDATLLNASAIKGWEPGGPGRLLLFDSNLSLREENDGLHNAVLSTRARYYHRNFDDQLFSATLTTVFSKNLDAENQVLLGGDNGLRGYPLRYQSGDHSAVLTLEQRFFTDWYPWRLVRVGYAFFMDAGRVWGRDLRGTQNLGALYDIGVGLRLTSPRSSTGAVVHLDLAFPLNGGSQIDTVQLIIEKKASL
jgi:Omp85 superfamily domain